MKNVYIVVRNKRDHFDGDAFELSADALSDGGFPADKIILLDESDAHEFMQTVIECKNFFDNIFIFSQARRVDGLRAKVCELVKCPPAAGIALEAGNKLFFCLPFGFAGAASVRGEVLPYLKEHRGVAESCVYVRACGVPSERMEKVVSEAKAAAPQVGICVQERYGDARIELSYADAPKMQVDEAQRILAAGLNDYIYAIDDTPLNRRVYELLKLRGQKLSLAESFTGGGVASALIEVPGVSEVLFESVVAYSNDSKRKRLGVSAETLSAQGAVSDETAYEMAAGLLGTGGCSVVLATTGIAGPASDNTNKPVGLCYIAVGSREAVYVHKYMFSGTREEITKRAITQALFLLYKQIK